MKTPYWIKQVIGTSLFFSILFLSAGRINYWQGWVYVAIGFVMVILSYTALQIDTELSVERSKPGENTKKWDKAILGLSLLATISMYIIGGLDSGRYHWSPDFHTGLYLVGMIMTASGQLLFLIAQKQNHFFSSTVRIQTDRNHTVCKTGLYSVVRHPAYMGSTVQALGFPLLFGSLWSIVPVCILVTLFIIRTNLEDRTLVEELEGYLEYSRETRYRIIPLLW